MNDIHNHDLLTCMGADSSYRKHKLSECGHLFQTAYRAGIAPRNIRTILGNENHSTSQDIYNEKQKHKKALIGSQTIDEKLIEILESKNWLSAIRRNGDGKIINLFMAHPESVLLAKKNNLVVVLDNTYKTNMLEFPLLNVVGMNCMNKTIFIALVAMQKETTNHYLWAMEHISTIYQGVDYPRIFATDREEALVSAIDTVFPQSNILFCTWHIQRNIVANCKKHFAAHELENGENANETFSKFLREWNNVCIQKQKLKLTSILRN